MLQIYYTLVVTSATAERTFSAMYRLKNYLRAIMTENELNDETLMHCHKHRIDTMDTVTKAFIIIIIIILIIIIKRDLV